MTVPRPVAADPASQLPGSMLLAAAVTYTAFAVYGSWVPLNFVALPLVDAWGRFELISWLDLGVGHRADWVANILLFVPLAFLWMATLRPRHWAARTTASAAVWAGASALAVAIEFSQVYFPGRTLSLNDIVAETIGSAIGVAGWLAVGTHVTAWLAGLRRESRPMGAFERLLLVYVVVVVFYALLPFDLTLSVTEIYRKWKNGALILVPLTFREARAADSVYSFLSEVGLWMPMGIFVVLRWGLGTARAVFGVAAGALVLEVLQIFVYSRTSDVNDVIAAAAGGAAGALFARRLGLAAESPTTGSALPSRVILTALLVLLWAAGAALVFLYPFNFNLDGPFLRGRFEGVPRVPFASYYWGSEYNAVTQVMRKMLYFVPLGAILAWGGAPLGSAFGRGLYLFLSVALAAGAAVAIEIGQLGLPGKIVDPTDAMLATIGAIAGWIVVTWVARLGSRPIR